MATKNDRSDLGIVFYGTNDGSGSFTNIQGTAGTVRTLKNTCYVASDWFYCGATSALTLTCSGDLSHGATSATIILERQRIDQLNASLFNPAIIGTARGDKASTAAASSQTIASADLSGHSVSTNADGSAPATETLDVVLLTTDQELSGQCRVIVTTTGAPGAGDKLIIAVNAGA